MKTSYVLLLGITVVACNGKERPQSSGPGVSSVSAGGGGAGAEGGSGGQGGVNTGGSGGAGDCTNNKKDGTETDVDCGGKCDGCDTGEDCKKGEDCASLVCKGTTCADATCTDMTQNQNETDVDCGGVCQKKCAANQMCITGDDCADKKCDNGSCTPATCSDLLKNGTESDIDCGGGCTGCPTGQACKNAGDCISNLCTGMVCACPMGMITIPIQGGGSYCIDSDEITYDEYDDFVVANPTNLPVPVGCEWNNPGMIGGEGYIPVMNWPPVANPNTAVNYRDKPVAYVDWCDAYAYCEWKGRKLCGQIGDSAQIPFTGTDYVNENEDQWYNACSASGTNVFPYGQAYLSNKCATLGVPYNTSASSPCLGGFSGLYNMSGNVAEWEASCGDLGAGTQCRLRGGGYNASGSDAQCNANRVAPIASKTGDVGFRCCL
jgi:formylglycine-generating enzyme required for sulfatase activity